MRTAKSLVLEPQGPVPCPTVMPRCLPKAVGAWCSGQHRPIAHVAAEMGISRQCASKWVARYRRFGELGLADRPSTPHRQPTATPAETVARIEGLCRGHKWSANRITHELAATSVPIGRRTVTRLLGQLGLGRRRFLDPTGATNRIPGRLDARWPGRMVHLDVKRSAASPTAAAGKPTDAAVTRPNESNARKPPASAAGMSTCTRPSTGSPGWPTPTRYRMRRPAPPSVALVVAFAAVHRGSESTEQAARVPVCTGQTRVDVCAQSLKSSEPKGSGGSNPPASALLTREDGAAGVDGPGGLACAWSQFWSPAGFRTRGLPLEPRRGRSRWWSFLEPAAVEIPRGRSGRVLVT